ncbi:hypothetical protein DFH06DRAFT_1481063 [Mycena polygramma]|nr:hypothetical protein DFH06DRAFT_1481063 [Mycena polygramma]
MATFQSSNMRIASWASLRQAFTRPFFHFSIPSTSFDKGLHVIARPNLSAGGKRRRSLDAYLSTLMLPASPLNDPWPERTAAPAPPLVNSHASTSKVARQVVADQAGVAAAKNQCQFASGNEVISCFPTADVVVPQHEFATFVWNSNNPDFLQTERVDIYLFHGDSLEQILFIPDQVNPTGQAGSIARQVNDTWWGTRGVNWAGSNISYPFYWLISRAGEPLSDGTQQPQTTFSAVQTTFADSVLASMAASSSSATSTPPTSSLQVVTTSVSGALTTVTTTPKGGVQTNSTGPPFPTWAIILIVLAIVLVAAICALMLFGIYCLRAREKRERRYPIRASSPDMAQADAAAPGAALAGGALLRDTSTSQGHEPVRTTSPTQRPVSSDSTQERAEPRPFSGSDAAIMANAFRTELRQPGRALDEEDAEGGAGPRTRSPDRPEAEREALLRRGLSSDGAGIRSVDSIRGVRVESSSEDHGRTSPLPL